MVRSRVSWFVAGAAAGATGAVVGARKVKSVAHQLKPVNVAKGAAGRVTGRSRDLAAAVRDGRAAMRSKEAELRAQRDGTPLPLPLPLAPVAGGATTVNYIVVTDPAQLPQLLAGGAEVTDLRDRARGPRRSPRRAR